MANNNNSRKPSYNISEIRKLTGLSKNKIREILRLVSPITTKDVNGQPLSKQHPYEEYYSYEALQLFPQLPEYDPLLMDYMLDYSTRSEETKFNSKEKKIEVSIMLHNNTDNTYIEHRFSYLKTKAEILYFFANHLEDRVYKIVLYKDKETPYELELLNRIRSNE